MNMKQVDVLIAVSTIRSLYRTDNTMTELDSEVGIIVSGLVKLPIDIRKALKPLGVAIDDDGQGLMIPVGNLIADPNDIQRLLNSMDNVTEFN